MLYLSDSMLACGSEFRFNRRRIILAFDLGSASSDSDFENGASAGAALDVARQMGITCSSSMEAASIRPKGARQIQVPWLHSTELTVEPCYLR